MIDLSRKTAMVYDLSGSFTHIAEAIVPDFGRTLYFSQWETGFSSLTDYLPGLGLDGIERIADPAEWFDKVDLAIFPDVGHDCLQEYLRQQGVAVWGSANAGRLERDRIFLKATLAGLKMDVPEYEIVHGLKALRKYLGAHKDVYVKISYFRGLSETYHHLSGFASEGWLDDKAVKLGPYQEEIDFLVEQPIAGDAVEVGIDTHAINGQLPRRMLWGYEDKDCGYLGTTSKVPERLRKTSEQFAVALEGYCGPLSTEDRTTEDADFLVDFTARFPSPPSEAECMNIANLAELMYQGAHGIPVEADYSYHYAAQLVVESGVVEQHPLAVLVGMPERVAIHGHCQFGGKSYSVSPMRIEEFAGAVGLADSLEGAIRESIEAAKSIEGDGVGYDESAFDRIMETIQKGERLGLTWGVPAED